MFWAFGEAQRQERRGCVLELREQGLRDSQDKQWELGGFRKVKARLLGPETRESRPAGGRVCRGGLEQRVSVFCPGSRDIPAPGCSPAEWGQQGPVVRLQWSPELVALLPGRSVCPLPHWPELDMSLLLK